MEITLLQGILIGLVSAFCYSGQLLGIYTNRALIMAFFVGLVLGDVKTAIYFGAIAELAFMGFGVGAGGTVPPNPVGPGIVGTIMAITLADQGVTPESALALSFPFAVLFQFVTTALYTAFSAVDAPAKKAIEEGKWKKFQWISHSTFIAFLVAGFVIGLASALSMPALEAFVNVIPAWLITGFSVAGGLIPALGFAMILSVMLDTEMIPYAILGYVAVAYFELPTMGVALLGTVFALIYYFNRDDVASSDQSVADDLHLEEDYSDGI